MPYVLEGKAKNEDRDGHNWRGEPNDEETGFGLDVALVSADVVGTDCVVDPVPNSGAEGGTDDGREVEES